MAVVLDQTPFYAESGGQVGDQGRLSSPSGMFQVMDTQRISGLSVHYGIMIDGYLTVGSPVEAVVTDQRHSDIQANHSATHLLHRALKDLLGESVVQHGSLVEPDRLRFDFNQQRALTDAEITTIDLTVNAWIRRNLTVNTALLPLEQARKSGAMALFGEKYPDPVRVVTMGSSKELCGGTHVASTGQIGMFVTVQESSSAGGIRRIEALTGRAAEEYLMKRKHLVDTLASHLQASPDTLVHRVEQLTNDLTAARKELARFQREVLKEEADHLVQDATVVQGSSVVAACVKAPNIETLREMIDHVRNRLDHSVILLATGTESGAIFAVSVSPELTKVGVHAGRIAQNIGEQMGGKGGGRPESAQGGGKSTAKMAEIVATVPAIVATQLKA